jgi:putative membrane protein
MVRSSYFIVALVATALLFTAAPVRASLSSEDKDLIKDAMRNIKSISDDSRVARENTHDEAIRSYASNVVGGHNKLVQQLRDIAEKNDFRYNEEATTPDKKETQRLDKLSGKELDKAYLQATIHDHEELLTIFKKGAKDARNSDLRDWFDKKQDAVRDHLEKAQSLQRDLKDKSRD